MQMHWESAVGDPAGIAPGRVACAGPCWRNNMKNLLLLTQWFSGGRLAHALTRESTRVRIERQFEAKRCW